MIDKRTEIANLQIQLIDKDETVNRNSDVSSQVRMIDKPLPENYIPSTDKIRKYYVYLLINNQNDKVFYVGKGSGNRAGDANSRSIEWKNYVLSINYDYRIVIHKDSLTSDEALKLENDLIVKYYLESEIINVIPDSLLKEYNVARKDSLYVP